MADSSDPLVLVGTLSADVVEGSRLHIVPMTGRAAGLVLPDGWRLESGAIDDGTGAVLARLGDRVAVTGHWIEGLVSLRGPSRVLRVRAIAPAPDGDAG